MKVNLLTYSLVLFVTFFSRRYFLEILGNDFMGLSLTLLNILGILNMAELGIGNAVGFMLYKPLVNKDTPQINDLITLFGYLYKKIGYAIFTIAVIVSLFLPQIIDETSIPTPLIYLVFYSYLISTLLSYFANYKQILLSSDQRNYIIIGYLQGTNALKILSQMAILYYTRNPYYWILMEIVFSLIYSIALNIVIKKSYPWLQNVSTKGRILLKTNPSIVKYTKQLIVHKISSLALYNLSPVFIYAYTSLATVTFFFNYQLIVQKLEQIISQALVGVNAGVGHLIAEGDIDRIKHVFGELLALRYLVAGVISITTIITISPFISIWLGSSYILPNSTLIIIVINSFIMIARGGIEIFTVGYGLFYDIWAPLIEAIVNITISIIGGMIWGLNGVLLGTTISLFVIPMLWKPYFLFSRGFKESVWIFWRKTLLYYIIIFITYLLTQAINTPITQIIIKYNSSYLYWALFAFIILTVSSVIMLSIMLIVDVNSRNITKRLIVMIKNK